MPFASPTPVQPIQTINSLNDGLIGITHRVRNLSSNRIGALAQRVDTQMRISLRRAGVLVPEQLANDGQPKALADPNAGKGMPQVVEANITQLSLPCHEFPWPLQVPAGLLRVFARDHVGAHLRD